jgi:4-hydroxy-tetrahydrodipicolinate reductase
VAASSSNGNGSSSPTSSGAQIQLALHGATGRMGLAITRLAHASGHFKLVGAAAHSSDPNQGKDLGELAGLGSIGVSVTADVASALLGADVVIDFSTASAVKPLISLATRAKVALVSGTTNLDDATIAAFDKAGETIPVLWGPNMSLGVQVLAELVEHALKRLGAGYDVEIVEIHHRKKIDSPSGTAKRLADAVRAVRSNAVELHGRDGDVGARTDREVAVLGVRGGDVVGDHTVFLLGSGERLELTHRATNRELFAHGAVRAAEFLVGKAPGRYKFADALG